MKTTTELLTIGSKVKVEAEIVESKLERDQIKYKIKIAKTWFTEDELETSDDDEKAENEKEEKNESIIRD